MPGSSAGGGSSARAAWRRSPARQVLPALGLLALAILGGCAPAESAGESVATTPLALAAASPDTTPVPETSGPWPDRPPVARLVGPGIPLPGAAGEEGTFTWGGLGSDAPWVVRSRPDVEGPGPWSVVLDPPLDAERWTVRWSRVTAGAALTEEQGDEGDRPAITVRPPRPPGAWSVQVRVRFAPDREATWYWRVDVRP